jgi:hypothetical protein
MSWPVPQWVAEWRLELERARSAAEAAVNEWRAGRLRAVDDLAALQPALAQARAAWAPYAQRVALIENDLRETLRPAMWAANHEARNAGFGHRRRAHRAADSATRAVRNAEAEVGQINNAGWEVKHHLDELGNKANSLHSRTEPRAIEAERLWEDDLGRYEHTLAALDTIERWYEGQSVSSSALHYATATIADRIRQADGRSAVLRRTTPEDWGDFLAPPAAALGLDDTPFTSPPPALERDGLGIEL